MALAIFKVGSHVSLLQALDISTRDSLEKVEQIGKQEYYNICNTRSSKIS